MRTNGFTRDGTLSLNAHQIGGTSVYFGLVVRIRDFLYAPPPPPFPPMRVFGAYDKIGEAKNEN